MEAFRDHADHHRRGAPVPRVGPADIVLVRGAVRSTARPNRHGDDPP